MTKPNYNQVTKPPRVAILAYNNLATFEFSCAVELFSLPRPDINNWYQTDIIAVETGELSAIGGFKVVCNKVFSSEKGFLDYDMIVVPGWNGGMNKRVATDSLIDAIVKLHKAGGTVLSFCSGAFVIAQSGLLNGKTATTHWLYEDDFRTEFPDINFVSNVLFTEEDRIYTAAGSASGLDLGIHIIRQHFGIGVANKVAKRLVIASQRQGGQSQFASQLQIKKPTSLLHSCMEWVLENLDQDISVNDMSEHACLSRRSFDRKFRIELGVSPKEWLIKQRIDRARDYLENTDLSVDTIVGKCGLGSPMNMRNHFSKLLGVSPTYYRKQFFKK